VIGVNRVGKDGNDITYSGNSLVIDPLGEVLYHMPDEEDAFTITLQKEKLEEIRKRFPFLQDDDSFQITD
jgi:predicted amidohydrolase